MSVRFCQHHNLNEETPERGRTLSTDSLDNETSTDVLAYPSGNSVIQTVTARVKANLLSSPDTAVACHNNLRYVIPKSSIHVVSRCSLWTKSVLILPSARNKIQSRLTISARRSVQKMATSVLRTLFLFRMTLCCFCALRVNKCALEHFASCKKLRIIRNKYPSGRRTHMWENKIHSKAPRQNLCVCVCVCHSFHRYV